MRKLLPTWLIAALGISVIAAPCTTTGPMQRNFEAGSLVIPMDNCYQRRDGSTSNQTIACNSSRDEGVFRAYGLVYYLLKHNVKVYWAIDDDASPKTTVTAADVTIGDNPVVERLDWSNFTFGSFGFSGSEMKYIGAPFIIDSADAATALDLFQNDADFARFRDEGVDVHRVQTAFQADEVRPLSGPPPRIAILAIDPQPYRKTSLDVMYKYVVAAGLDDSDPNCEQNGTCAGGLGASCDSDFIRDYLNDSICNVEGDDTCPEWNGSAWRCASGTCICSSCSPDWVSPAITTARFNHPGTPGRIFDILCDGDFIPPQGGTYSDTYLASGDYKLLWIPHWDTGGITPTVPASRPASPPAASPTNDPSTSNLALRQWQLSWQLDSIASYMKEGNNLFVECLGIGALEGGEGAAHGLHGIADTRFQTTNGMMDSTSRLNSYLALDPFAYPAEPNIQIGDFSFLGSDVDGAITTFYPDNASSNQQSVYRSWVQRLIYGTAGDQESGMSWDPYRCSSSLTCARGSVCNGSSQCVACPDGQVSWGNWGNSSAVCVQDHPWDVATVAPFRTPDGVEHGRVAYLGGHDYSPNVNNTPGQTGQTAGTRIVLNTLFNMGFGCSDPNTDCNTGLLGACSNGTLKCAAGGGLRCEPPAGFPTETDSCDGKDSDCDGIVDDGCNQAECTSDETRSCYDGAAGTAGVAACMAGTQTCTGGFWGGCEGQVLPAPEVCNAKDDDCNGQVDDGNLCGSGRVCTSGVCLPTSCNGENAHCPEGFSCPSGTCTAVTCDGATTQDHRCQPPEVCRSGACVDPCSTVTCGPGSACSGGSCTAGGCALTGCIPGQTCVEGSCTCVDGSCVADPCAGVSCPTGTFCRLGDCVRSCSYVECPPGSTCDADGFCPATCSPECGAGQTCVNGTCATDPCAGITCAGSQVCHDGTCIDDPCAHVICPAGTCQLGQCRGAAIVTSETRTVEAENSGGCGSTGPGGLASLALLLALLWRRRAPPAALSPGRRAGVALAAAAALAVGAGAAGCSKGSSSCSEGQTKCGSACVDLVSSIDHCGVCGRRCSDSFQCSASACVLPTPNPLLTTVSPSALGLGSKVPLQLTGTGFQQGATLRVSGPGLAPRELGLTVDAAGESASSDTLDLSGVPAGTADVRVANPGQPEAGTGRFTSNALRLTIAAGTALTGIDPPMVRQDQSATVLTLTGAFQQGATVTLQVPGGAAQTPTATFVNESTLTVGIEPGALAVGSYSLTVTNPGSTAASLPFPVIEGQPTLTSLTPTCEEPGTSLDGAATGNYLYPKSTVYAKGGIFPNGSVLPAQCLLDGTDDLGRCKEGKLRVTADLPANSAGTYDVTVVNPGSQPSNALQFQVEVSCP